MRRWCLLAALIGWSLSAAEGEALPIDDAEVAAIAAALKHYQALQAAQPAPPAGGTVAQAIRRIEQAAASQTPEQRAAAAELDRQMSDAVLAEYNTDHEKLLNQLATSMGAVIGESDHGIAATLSAQKRLDANPQQTFARSDDGLVWIFWAVDAPLAERLPFEIAEIERLFPSLPIFDSHLMTFYDWIKTVEAIERFNAQMQVDDPRVDDEEEAARKWRAAEDFSAPMMAMTAMSHMRRRGGYLATEDMTAAITYGVNRVPTVIYWSPQGVVHRVSGLRAQQTIAEWMQGCLAWEESQQDLIDERMRGLEWDE